MMGKRQRPERVFDLALQHERTALAWERTAIAAMVAGVVLARYATTSGHYTLGFLGLVQTLTGGGLLLWTGRNYERLHGPIRDGNDVVHPVVARMVGLSTVAFTAIALMLAVLLTLTD